MMALTQWWMRAAVSDVPVLPDALAMHIDRAIGWALVTAFLVAGLTVRCSLRWRRMAAGAMALWALAPATASITYWLGLAFQTPGITMTLVCALLLRSLLWPANTAASPPTARQTARLWWASAGVLLGYLLLLDTFAVLPISLYAWGFTTQAVVVTLALSLLPWVLCSKTRCQREPAAWLVPVAIVIFVLTRLPTGNLWDAVLDPWLWIGLHAWLLQAAWRKFRFRPVAYQ